MTEQEYEFTAEQEKRRIIETIDAELQRINDRATSYAKFATIQEQHRIIRLITKEVPPGLANRFIRLIIGEQK